jgi:hypothetical protein
MHMLQTPGGVISISDGVFDDGSGDGRGADQIRACEIPAGVAAEGAFAAVEDAFEGGLAGEGVGDGFLIGAEIGGR